MPDATPELVAESLVEALELMGFIFAMPPEGPAAPPEQAIDIRLPFSGSLKGVVRLVAPLELGVKLAANILPPETPAEELPSPKDALGELANVACGVVIRRLGGDKALTIDMGLPLVVAFNPVQWPALCAAPNTCVLDAEGLTVALALDGVPAPASAQENVA